VQRVKRNQWDEESFFAVLEHHKGTPSAQIARQILDWVRARHMGIWWGQGVRYGSFFPLFEYFNVVHFPIAVWTNGKIEIQFQHMLRRIPFDAEDKRREFLDYLNSIDGINIPQDGIRRRPSFPISTLQDKTRLEQFLRVLDWYIEEVKNS
jgi:hypothetical protein